MTVDAFFVEQPGPWGSEEVFNEDFVRGLIRHTPKEYTDAEVAEALCDLVQTSLFSFATSGTTPTSIPTSGMPTALRALKAVLTRLGIAHSIPWRDYDGFRSYWVARGAVNTGSWAKRRAILADTFDPIHAALESRLSGPSNPEAQAAGTQQGWGVAVTAAAASPATTSQEEVHNLEGVAGVTEPKPQIFIVHGHDVPLRNEVELFIRRATDVQPIILNDQVNQGRTLLEKFENYANAASYAVVLLTGDDLGKAKGVPDNRADADGPDRSLSARGRQNVVFEMGYFHGKLGRHRVAVINESGVEKPGDIDGIVYIGTDEDWKNKLGRELNAAGIHVDLFR